MTPSWFSWRQAIRRCATIDKLGARVTTGEISFMECEFPTKVVFLSDPSAELHKGQHGLSRSTYRETKSNSVAVFHLPMRARSELLKRANDYEPRRAGFRTGPDDAWQSLYWRTRVVEGHVDSEWQALSYDERGELFVDGRRVSTFIDRRLVAHLYRAALTTRYRCAGVQMIKPPKG